MQSGVFRPQETFSATKTIDHALSLNGLRTHLPPSTLNQQPPRRNHARSNHHRKADVKPLIPLPTFSHFHVDLKAGSFAMTRRHTVGSRSEMGLLNDTPEPRTPPPVWSSALSPNIYTWRKPSKWQICMPRLRSVTKLVAAFVLSIFLYQLLYHKPQDAPLPPPTEDQSRQALSQENWAWKDFPQHDGLTRGTIQLKSCAPDEEDCRHTSPQLFRYDGYKHFQESASEIAPCVGPRGLWMNESDDDAVWAYHGKAAGAVDPVIGSYEASGLDGDVSFDRIGRYQAYGLDQFESMDVDGLKISTDVDWENVRWGELQAQCVEDNHRRFRPFKRRPDNSIQYSNVNHKHGGPGKSPKASEIIEPSNIKPVQRTAILVRVWTGAPWTADAVLNLRALIVEASLASGGKYQVFVLLHVKDEVVPLFVGEHEPEATIHRYVPPEFHSMTEVWNHAQTRSLYSGLSEHAFVGRSPWMIVQWFARNHPEFDFFYQWEFDVRYTGHYLDFFEAVSTFGKAQPRKQIWERADRVYIPSVHGAFDTEFRKRVAEEDPHHVWGPVKVEGVKPRGPKAPHQQDIDDYSWGKGEDADWIGFLPSFNITNTNWWFRDYLWGYSQGTSTPRRATLIAQGRVSRRVLDIMNYENAQNGHHLDAEMFPQTMCLHHGLKSTTFPHPIFADRVWPPEILQSVFNPGPFGQAGGVWESTFSKWNEYAWSNMTWYYNSAQAKPIFQRLLGVTAGERGGSEWEDVNGRTVVRPMLLHPVKFGKAWTWQEGRWLETKGEKS